MPEWSSRRRKALRTPVKLRNSRKVRIAGWRASDPNCGARLDNNRSWRCTVGAPTPYSRRHRFLERTFLKSRPGTAHRVRSRGHAHGRITSLLGLGAVIGGDKKALLSRRRFTMDWSKLDIYFRHLKKKLNSGMGSTPVAFSTLKTGWRIAHILEASLGYIASLCLKTTTTNPNNKKS